MVFTIYTTNIFIIMYLHTHQSVILEMFIKYQQFYNWFTESRIKNKLLFLMDFLIRFFGYDWCNLYFEIRYRHARVIPGKSNVINKSLKNRRTYTYFFIKK